jgi:hypothetical protein
MTSKKWAGIIPILTVLFAVLCLAAPAMAATWEVNPDGTGHFTTIQAALNSEWTNGDTIEIAYAVYKEPVAVNANGRDLTITGIPSPAGDLPVIDGMNGAIELPGLVDRHYGCGGCSMYLYNGDFTVSSLCVTNASSNGLVVRSGNTVHISNFEAVDNGDRGINVILKGGSSGDLPADPGECSVAVLTDILVMDNGGDGLFVKGSGLSTADISRVVSTGNDADGVVLNGFADFTVSDMVIDGNGDFDCDAGRMSVATAADTTIETTGGASYLRCDGNGLFVMCCGNGTIDGVDATNNVGVGIIVDVTGDVVISHCNAVANGYTGIFTMSLSDESRVLMGGILSDSGMDMDSATTQTTFETAFTEMTAFVADATVVSEDEFILADGVSIFVDDIVEEGPDVTLSSIMVKNNGYAGIGVIAPYVVASDITANENGASPTDVARTLTGAGILGASFIGEYSDIAAAANGGAGMAAASLTLDIEDAVFTGNGAEAYSDIHGRHFQTGLLTVSLVGSLSGVHSDENAGAGILTTSVITVCEECSASGNGLGGIVAVDPLSLGIAAVFAHVDMSDIMDGVGISGEDRFYLNSLSSPAMQDVVTCYGTTDTFVPSAVADIDIGNVTEDDVAFLIGLLHQYMAVSGIYVVDSAADGNELFGMAVVYPNVVTGGFSADGNGNDGGSILEAVAGIGIVGVYQTGTFIDTSASDNTGAGIVTIGVESKYIGVTADDNGYAGIVTIDPLTLAAAALGYFVILDDTGDQMGMTADATEMTDLEMHANIAKSEVVQDIVATYYTGTTSADSNADAVIILDGGMDILLEHIERYFENAGVYAYDVSASGNGYPGFVAIGPNVVMDGVTADGNGAANDEESDVIALVGGSGIIGLSIVGDYTNIAANGNTGAGIATAGIVTDMTACDADENGVGVVSLFIVGDYTEIGAAENAGPGIVLAGINGTLTASAAAGNAGPGILCVDPVAAALMYLFIPMTAAPFGTADSMNGMDATFKYETDAVSPETLALLCQLSGTSGSTNGMSPMGGGSETETTTAWTLIEWAVGHVFSYEGDITELNETEIIDLVLAHYLTNAGMSVSDVTADNNGCQGIVVLSPSITVADVAAEGNWYDGVSVFSPWKAVDAFGTWVHPTEPVGAERLSVREVYAVSNDGSGLAITGANGGEVMGVYGSDNLVGLILGDSDHLMVLDSTFETNRVVSVLCGGSQFNSIIPIHSFLPDGAITVPIGSIVPDWVISDPTGSCNNAFSHTEVDGGIAVFMNSSGNVFGDTFFDEAQEIAADISGDGPFVLYSTSGFRAPVLPDPQWGTHMSGCGIGVIGLGGFNTAVNITYDYSHGYPETTGATLYPQWAVNATTPWEYWRFNAAGNDPVAMTIGPMQVPVTPSAAAPCGEIVDLMFIAPFWKEPRCDDDPGHDAFMRSLAENKKTGYIGPDGVFVPYAQGEIPVESPGTPTGDGEGDTSGDDTGSDTGDDTGTPQQPGGDGSSPGAAVVTATATSVATTPAPTTTPVGVAPVIGALGVLGALAVIRRR